MLFYAILRVFSKCYLVLDLPIILCIFGFNLKPLHMLMLEVTMESYTSLIHLLILIGHLELKLPILDYDSIGNL